MGALELITRGLIVLALFVPVVIVLYCVLLGMPYRADEAAGDQEWQQGGK